MMNRRGVRSRVLLLVLGTIVVVSALVVPAAATARSSAPAIVGTWNVDGLGTIYVRENSNGHWRGTVVNSNAGCLHNGELIWKIDQSGGGSFFTGSVAFFNAACQPVGFGPTQWTLNADLDSGQLCGTPPDAPSQTPECHNFGRVGAVSSPPAVNTQNAFDSVFISCTGEVAFFLTNGAFCNRYFYLPKAGRLQTTVMYCTEFSNGYSSLFGSLPVCPGYTDQSSRLFFGARDAKGKPKHPDRAVVLAKSVVSLKAPGYSGVDVTLSGKAHNGMKLVAKHHVKVPVTIVSIFTPAHGKPVIRAKHETIKLR